MMSFDGLKLTVALDGGRQMVWEFQSIEDLNDTLAEWARVADPTKVDSE